MATADNIRHTRVTEDQPYNGNIPAGLGLDVAAGRFNNITNSFLGARNASVGSTNLIISPLAPVNGLDITFPVVGVTMSIISDNVNDTAGGTGATTIFLSGLDDDYNEITDLIALNGTTPVLTSKPFLRTNLMIVTNSGTGKSNLGNIYLSIHNATFNESFEPVEVLYRTLDIGSGFSQTAICTVPAGHTAQVDGITASSDASPSKPVRVTFQIYRPAPVNTTYDSIRLFITEGLSNFPAISSQTQQPKSDFILRAQVTQAGSVELAVHLRHFFIKSSNNENIKKIGII